MYINIVRNYAKVIPFVILLYFIYFHMHVLVMLEYLLCLGAIMLNIFSLYKSFLMGKKEILSPSRKRNHLFWLRSAM